MTPEDRRRIEDFYGDREALMKRFIMRPAGVLIEAQNYMDIALAEISRLEAMLAGGVEVWVCRDPAIYEAYGSIERPFFDGKTGSFRYEHRPLLLGPALGDVVPGECCKARIILEAKL